MTSAWADGWREGGRRTKAKIELMRNEVRHNTNRNRNSGWRTGGLAGRKEEGGWIEGWREEKGIALGDWIWVDGRAGGCNRMGWPKLSWPKWKQKKTAFLTGD